MRISLIQMDIVWGDPQANCQKMRSFVAENPGADLYVLPEMFSTGFNGDAELLENGSVGTLEAMKSVAAGFDCAVAGSVAVSDGHKRWNRFYFVKPDGSVATYDKKHLFTYSGEQNLVNAGAERVIVEWRGVRFLLLVCYDLRFPVWARNRGDYDTILCVASWPTVRRYPWDTLLRARAIENQCFVAGVDRVGTDPSCVYNGGSVLLDPWGQPVAACPDDTECLVSAELDLVSLEKFRASFPVLDDADDFKLI